MENLNHQGEKMPAIWNDQPSRVVASSARHLTMDFINRMMKDHKAKIIHARK